VPSWPSISSRFIEEDPRVAFGARSTARELLERWRGTEHDTAGEGFYATFEGPAAAIRCALDITERVRDLGIEVRAGVQTGECELVDRQVGGIGATIGARISSLAAPSEVLVSGTVKGLVTGSGSALYVFRRVG